MELPDEEQMISDATAGMARAASGARSVRSKDVLRGPFRPKMDVREFELTSELTGTAALAMAQQILAQAGGAAHATAGTAQDTALRGMFGVGMGGLNPVVVTFTVRSQSADAATAGSAVHVRTAAREGLIKQRGAQKGADRMRDLWVASDPSAQFPQPS